MRLPPQGTDSAQSGHSQVPQQQPSRCPVGDRGWGEVVSPSPGPQGPLHTSSEIPTLGLDKTTKQMQIRIQLPTTTFCKLIPRRPPASAEAQVFVSNPAPTSETETVASKWNTWTRMEAARRARRPSGLESWFLPLATHRKRLMTRGDRPPRLRRVISNVTGAGTSALHGLTTAQTHNCTDCLLHRLIAQIHCCPVSLLPRLTVANTHYYTDALLHRLTVAHSLLHSPHYCIGLTTAQTHHYTDSLLPRLTIA